MEPNKQAAAEEIEIASDFYLKDVCSDEFPELSFKQFTSYDFVYDSPFPVRVSGAYYEVRGRDSNEATTIYDDIEATIYRDVKMVVEAKQSAPQFSFDRWQMPFAVSDHPFTASRQLKHQRAMGSTFPFLELAEIPYLETNIVGRRAASGSSLSRNFVSTLNFLTTRGENVWGRDNSHEERQKARELRLSTTGTEYERPQPIGDDELTALRRIPMGEKLSLSTLDGYLLISLGKPARFIAVIDINKDAVGLCACKGGL